MGSLNKSVYFNELSFDENLKECDFIEIFRKYANTIKALRLKGFDGVKYENGIASLIKEGGCSIFDLKKIPKERDVFAIILTTARSPYIDPDSEAESKYVNATYEVNVDNEWISGEGFTASYLNNSVAVSIDSHHKWGELKFPIRHQGEDQNLGAVMNVNDVANIESEIFLDFIETITPICLIKCTENPTYKKWSFRDDHGKDKLIELWNKLRNNEYVISAINSLPFDSFGKEYIENCTDDGKIYIRLCDSKKGYGMVIQTTGRTLKETNEIGKILLNKYF